MSSSKARRNSIFMLLFLWLCVGSLHAVRASPQTTTQKQHGPILVVGATGSTGLRALKGLLDAGCQASKLRLMTRNPNSVTCQLLQEKLGIHIVQADLDRPDDKLQSACRNCVGCYVHALSGDTREVTLGGETRAQTLLEALKANARKNCHVVFNSAAAEENHGVERIQQTHSIEGVFRDDKGISFTSLRANFFMEELWKKYTRPSILKGKFPMSVPSDRKIYLTSVRDMGNIAGFCILNKAEIGQIVNVAGDVLSAQEIASAFPQNNKCKHSSGFLFALFCKFFFKELYEIIRFYRNSTETTDVALLQKKFPMLTNFRSFLDETQWENEELTYENYWGVDKVLLSD